MPVFTNTLPLLLSREITDSRLRCSLALSEADECFRGHFPGIPVLAGITQVDWVMQLAVELGFDVSRFSGMPRVKFKLIVRPPITLNIEIDKKSAGAFRFRVSSLQGMHSEGAFNQ